jgi:hypothetical protein
MLQYQWLDWTEQKTLGSGNKNTDFFQNKPGGRGNLEDNDINELVMGM